MMMNNTNDDDDEIYLYISMYLGIMYPGTAKYYRGARIIRDTGARHLAVIAKTTFWRPPGTDLSKNWGLVFR